MYSFYKYFSTYGVGCKMFQTNEDRIHKTIAYLSSSLNNVKKDYSSTELE